MEGKAIERPSNVAAVEETFKKAPESKKKHGHQKDSASDHCAVLTHLTHLTHSTHPSPTHPRLKAIPKLRDCILHGGRKWGNTNGRAEFLLL
jgi:hypothetical protein